ncbi:MAG TPA: transglutaminase domain-containing protein [Candidatus Angelobacter sp.]|nr:transglutaminase domain-containing protein [Candidatus Angelobacter sp.]
MRRLRWLLLVVGCAAPLLSSTQRDSWLPISDQEKSIKDVPGNAGADAIQLYYAQDIDDNSDNNNAEWDYCRIKVLTEKGRDRGDVHIVVPDGFHVRDLKARTIHSDGNVFEFRGKSFEDVIVKGGGLNYQTVNFAFPEVTVGSILEYRYKMDYPPNLLPQHVWQIQHDLYTLKEKFELRAYVGGLEEFNGLTDLSANYNLPPGVKPQTTSDGWVLTLNNVPAFQAEPFMPPADPYIYRVTFHYGQHSLAESQKYWQSTGLTLYATSEAFIGNHKEIREAAAQAIGTESDPEKKLRKLYARVQQVRNLSYERPRTEAEQKKEDLKTNANAADVLERGYGTNADIAYLFAAMARSAGFDASVVMSSNRSETMFDPNLLEDWQLAAPIVMVNIAGGKQYLLDPGTRFCPFGYLRWYRTATQALVLTKNGGVMVNIPLASQANAILERNAEGTIDPDGNLKGGITVRYSGYRAMEQRIAALETDEAGRKKRLEEQLENWLPPGAVVTLKDAQPWDSSEQPLEAHFTVTVPSYASVAGKRLLAPNYLFRTTQKDAFAQKERKYPVYFHYAFAEIDNVKLKVPSGFRIENAPQQQDASLPYARYQNIVKVEGDQIATRRALLLGLNFFPMEKYQELKDFFGKVESGDEQQAVLQEGTVSAQK